MGPVEKVSRIKEIIHKAESDLSQVCGSKVSISIKLLTKVLNGRNEIDHLKYLICKKYGVTWTQLTSKSRVRDIVKARHTFMFIANTQLGMTKTKIGKMFNRDHTTVIHAISTINDMYFINDPMIITIEEIKLLTA